MSHVRKQVRLAIKDALTALNQFGPSVFTDRRAKTQQDQLPAVLILTPTETLETLIDDRKERQQTVTVEVVGGAGISPDDLDDLCVPVEEALDGSDLDGLVVLLELVSVETDFTRDDEAQIGSALMTFNATLHTAVGDAETSV